MEQILHRSLTSNPVKPVLGNIVAHRQLVAPAHSSPALLQLCDLQPSTRSRRHCTVLRAAAILSPPTSPGTEASAQTRPTSAETARTIVDISHFGTLSTVSETGSPLGTFITYVLDERGEALLRLRADAVHTRNLQRNPQCSLFIQPQDLPARLLARATLIGEVAPLDSSAAAAAAQQHALLHYSSSGIDAPQPTDLFYRLNIHECFYVGGIGSTSAAEYLDAELYRSAEPDPLRRDAPALVSTFNRERTEDVLRVGAFAVGQPIEQTYAAELLWIDKQGVYLSVLTAAAEAAVVCRVTFHRPVLDERDARSVLTLLAQVAWERERSYEPAVPATSSP
ncbi:hypothetical protein WJX73_004581 [Symbiochloris irregularis]|uniref:DUF2470 domain-containing protein n=1 Tax=Symbiochloris irregularis TaxID=706552 RepID=A0AAW1PE98_9CHLO